MKSIKSCNNNSQTTISQFFKSDSIRIKLCLLEFVYIFVAKVVGKQYIKLFIVLIVLFFNSSFCNSQTREEYIRLGLICSEQSDYKNAILILDEALNKYNDDSELLIVRGEIKSKMSISIQMDYTHVPSNNKELFKDALNDINRAIKVNPNFCHAYHSRGFLYMDHQLYDKAINDYSKYLNCSEADSNRFKALLNRAVCYLRKGNWNEALNDFNNSLKINSKFYGTYLNIASIYSEQKQYNKAEEYLKIALSIDSLNVSILNNLGFLKIEKEEYNEALNIFNKLNENNPNDPFILNNLGFVQYKLGYLEEGFKNINKSISIYPDNSYAYKNRGLMNLSLSNKKQACEDFKTAIKMGYLKTYGNDIMTIIEVNCK